MLSTLVPSSDNLRDNMNERKQEKNLNLKLNKLMK
jgi:hypothetical protein